MLLKQKAHTSYRRFPKRHRKLSIVLVAIVAIAIIWPLSEPEPESSSVLAQRQSLALGQKNIHEQQDNRHTTTAANQTKAEPISPLAARRKQNNQQQQDSESIVQQELAVSQERLKTDSAEPSVPSLETIPLNQAPSPRTEVYTIAKGDTLSTIFEQFDIGQSAMYQVLEADVSLLALDTLKPGDLLKFWIDEHQQLQKLEIRFNPAHQVLYSRVDDKEFTYEDIIIDGDWAQFPIKGIIEGSFSVSADRAGLTRGEVAQVAGLFKDKINFNRDFRVGDTFEIVRNRQFINGVPSGQSELSAIRLGNQKRELSAYLYQDGNYYDVKGDSLARAFLRRPLTQNYRVSSSFNPNRKHPVTGRIRPHNGVDFATPRGTKVLAAGDGVVTRIENHPYAGKYIVIEHGGQYRTRYLHLNKFKVSKGQAVSRGQTIALSGNTGRSTGPHLHYEFHINGRPVNPLTAKIPVAAAIDSSERDKFQALVKELNQMMEAG
ncbi:peptidase M23 [Alginatibacterium sediminis]|uniref:Peptidase M23 n=1 Tax=Alginatibacterium sediminis TaxID=2164068 RepID=A0A420ECS5_9ALTE|nr:peptidoglycan DD-metalloendopeptidase family protein [Alginatibacterium sediminis]RKF18476.1 peptidase M23 [Alginatibacterium sediminis]